MWKLNKPDVYLLNINGEEYKCSCPYFIGMAGIGGPGELQCEQSPNEQPLPAARFFRRCCVDPSFCNYYVDRVKQEYGLGMKIRLIEMKGESKAEMSEGLEGDIVHIDDIGQLHMKWSNGRTLPLSVYEDTFEVI